MTVSNKTMERIMRQDSNLSPYDGFRIGGIGKVLNQIGLNQRKHHIIYKQPVIGRYEGMLEIAGHEFLVAGIAGRENGCMTLGLSFLEDHKPWGRKGNEYFAAYIDSGSGICTAKPGVFPKEARETLPIKMESESKKFTAFSTPQGAYCGENPNFPDVLKDKKQLQSFLGVVNFAGIFIKDLAKYRKDFRPLLKETESAKWKWEEIHTQRVRELKQVCNNLPKLAIPQDEDELVVYTDANDYRWATVLMKKTTTGKNLVDTQEDFLTRDGGFEANSVMLRLRHLRENLESLTENLDG
ncbi:hypothetical protein Sango_3062500 [Sesamum angolense]|uniref:Reverse transcriptase/retrotransposon-derived protein RNase H-like domain-containing protein n=1 Tax=Sesamum angolense TaxID=2727404 RepID=A0AAE1T9K2_9LAMI|nr:hypothetical protein Sango_3062500 [Sesamum angolense]